MRGIARRARRRYLPIIAGAMMSVTAGFIPVVVIHTSGSSATETIPNGAASCEVQAWASGGYGGAGSGSGCASHGGGGGGAGGYSRCTFNVSAQNTKTFTYTVGAAPTVAGTNGNNSTVSSGTFTISLITCNAGQGGANAPATSGGVGGTASNGNAGAVVTTGGSGTAGSTLSAGNGANGTAGNVTGDGSPYGRGGNGGFTVTNTGLSAGGVGAVVFAYT